MLGSDRSRTSASPADLDVFGVAGVATFVLFVGKHASGLHGEDLEWRLYMLLGTAFPALLVGVPLCLRRWPGLTQWFTDGAVFLRYLGLTMALALVIPAWNLRAFAVAAIAMVLAARIEPQASGHDPSETPRARLRGGLTAFLALVAASLSLPRMMYWAFSPDDLWVYQYGWESLRAWQVAWLFVLVAAFGVVLNGPPSRPLGVRGRRVAWGVALFVLGAEALRLPDFSYWMPVHHWGVFVGPVQLVRDGGLLLWDVPAQYGFLSMAVSAAVPFDDPWEAFRTVNAVAIAGSGIFVFALFFALKPTRAGFVAALLLAFTGVYIVPGESHVLRGIDCYPSMGAFRFWSAYAMMGVALWEARALLLDDRSSQRQRRSLAVGSAVWVFAILWAPESAVYATATWLPALLWSRFLLARRSGASLARAGVGALLTLVAPALLLVVSCALIDGWYQVRYGIHPDVTGYIEYPVAFSRFLDHPVEPLGPGLTLFVAFLLLSTALSQAFLRSGRDDLQVVALAAWGASWSATSYFVPRSPPANATTMIPIFLASLLILWWASRDLGSPWRGRTERWIATLFMAFVAFTGTFEPTRLQPAGRALVQDWYTPIASIMPRVPRAAEELFMRAGVEPGDRIVSLSPNVLGTFGLYGKPGARRNEQFRAAPWLPLYPAAIAHPLGHERWRQYASRYTKRQGITGGWYIRPRNRPYLGKGYLWNLDLLMDERYPAVEVWSNDEFILEWRGGPRPRSSRGVPGELPPPPLPRPDPLWQSIEK